jgi:hypothetical protein
MTLSDARLLCAYFVVAQGAMLNLYGFSVWLIYCFGIMKK